MFKGAFIFPLICFYSSLFFFSCEQGQDKTEPKPHDIVGTWIKTNVDTFNASFGKTLSLVKPCDFDDIEEFSKDGKWIFADGPQTCNSSRAATYIGTYSLDYLSNNVTTYTFGPGPYYNYGSYKRHITFTTPDKMILTNYIDRDPEDFDNLFDWISYTYVRK